MYFLSAKAAYCFAKASLSTFGECCSISVRWSWDTVVTFKYLCGLPCFQHRCDLFNGRGEAMWHVWKPAGIKRKKALYCSSQHGVSRCIRFKYLGLFVSFCGDLTGDYNGNLHKFIPALQNNKIKTKPTPLTLKIRFLIKFFIFDWKFNFWRKINVASWVTVGWFHHY